MRDSFEVRDRLSRRSVLGALATAPLAACAARGVTSAPAPPGPLTVYSPAPENNPLHALNLQLLRAAEGEPALEGIAMVAMALPASVNTIAALGVERPRHLPIVTTVDFRPAREGGGPGWHGYPDARPDLRFVATLYDVGFGIQPFDPSIIRPCDLRGKRIGAPPRPSAVRLLTETLIGDGWGLSDEVEIVDLFPGEIAGAVADGRIDATSWNLVVPGPAGFAPMTPPLPGRGAVRYLAVGDDALERINAANPFVLAPSELLPGRPPLLSFAQALAAWDDSDPARISALLGCLAARGGEFVGYPRDVAAMARWPGLRPPEVNATALEFYRSRGVAIAG